MVTRNTLLKTGLLAITLGCLLACLLFSNIGLRAIAYAAKAYIPYTISYESLNGAIIGQPIDFVGLRIRGGDDEVLVERLSIDWRRGRFSAGDVRGFENLLPYAANLAIDNLALISVVEGEFRYGGGIWDLSLQASGIWQQRVFTGRGMARYDGMEWIISEGRLCLGKNLVEISGDGKKLYKWNLDLLEPGLLLKAGSGVLRASGVLDMQSELPNLHARVESKNFAMLNFEAKDLRVVLDVNFAVDAPFNIDISAQRVVLDNIGLNKVSVSGVGSYKRHDVRAKLWYEGLPFSLSFGGEMRDAVWYAKQIKLRTTVDYLQGDGRLDMGLKRGTLTLAGKVFDVATDLNLDLVAENRLHIMLKMFASHENFMTADVVTDRDSLSGQIVAQAQDLNILMRWMPDVTRLKGVLSTKINLAGTIREPLITSSTRVSDITATLPRLGIKIKPMSILIQSDAKQRFTVTGHGKMRRGPGEFKINGYFEPFADNFPNHFKLLGVGVEFINNDLAHLNASPQLSFNYDYKSNQLNILGDLVVHSGSITYAKAATNTVKSKDVVFVDNQPVAKLKREFRINPNIFIRLEEGVRFIGLGLDADISGKLAIASKHDMLFGDGRITLKSGTYSLPGQNLHIEKGRILYPPGTLLVNPLLDIKLHDEQHVTNISESNKTEIVVQGSANQPQIYATGLEADQDKALSQALMTSSGLVSNNWLLSKLKVSEIGVSGRNDAGIEFFNDPSKPNSDLKNKDLIIGRPLGRKLYVQYMHGLGDANQKLRMRYALSKHLFIGVESGTQGGGADLSFSFERD